MGKEMNVEEVERVLMKRILRSSSYNKNNNEDNDIIIKDRLPLPLLSLNHVSFVCKSVKKSVQFYEQVLGFVLIQRPSSFDFEGAWLFNHGIGIHLLEVENGDSSNYKGKINYIINPKDNHISFQCSDMNVIVNQLEEMKIEYVKAVVKEGGIIVDQIFFHDPDGYMIEICNCQNLPLLPISSDCPLKLNNNYTTNATATATDHRVKKIPTNIANRSASSSSSNSSFYGKMQYYCSGEVEALMMENLAIDMMNISI